MSIREKIFNYCLRKQRPRKHAFINWTDVKTVFLLFESDITEKNIQIKQLIKELQQQGKEVTAWGYLDSKKSLSAILRDYRVLSRSDINLFHKPKENHLKDLAGMHFDVVIDLSMHDILPLRYLLLFSDTDLKVSRQVAEPYIADFMVMLNQNDDPAFLFDQITYYLQNINRK